MSTSTVTIDIDGRRYQVAEGANLLAAALGAGLDLPYFCWHPALGSVGACRQCAVKQYKDDDDTDGRIAMACMTPVADGARFSIDDPEARRFRQGVVEMLMANHPHDCPVCEEGGECHLQDVTVMTGQVLRRYRGPKRTHRNQDLGPFLNHEMNRCIACYRCVRFYRDYAGGRDLDAFASREQVYFGRAADGALENPFAGNLAEVCPTGVFTDRTFSAHYARKWDLQCAPSICVHCALGCNTSPGARDGTLRRIVNRYHGEVNGYFLCDRGRFGYDFVNHAARLRAPRLREAGATRTLSADETLALLASWLGDTRRAIGIGSPRASLESNFALRALVGAESFHCGLAGHAQRLVERCLARLREGPPTPTLREVEATDAAFVLGEDPTGGAPRLALALRQAACTPGRAAAAAQDIPAWHDAAVRTAGFDAPHALHLASPAATELDDVAATRWRGAPDELARLALAVAHAIDPAAPRPPDLDVALAGHAGRVAAALVAAERPLVVAGTALGSAALIDAAANVARALQRRDRDARLAYTFAECNDAGAALLGGAALDDALAAMAAGEVDLALVLENDLFRRAPQAQVSAALAATPRLVVLDHVDHATARAASLVLPVGHFAESSGTLVSSEGRAQRFFAALAPQPPVADAWRWLGRLRWESGVGPGWRTLDALLEALAEAFPGLAALRTAAPDAAFRLTGARIARAPQRASGRTALDAARTMFEPAPARDKDSPLAHSMEGRHGPMPPALRPFAWAPGWNSVQAVNKFQAEIGGPLAGGDPGVRLIAPADEHPAYLASAPPPFAPRPGQWLLLALPQVFGSEELSALAPAVAERAGTPALALGAEDAAALGLVAGARVTIETGDQRLRLPVQIAAGLPTGLAALPAGAGECAGLPLPAWGRLLPEDGR